MIAMRYGSVPLVRSTGGLADTVAPLTKGGGGIKPTGFTFKKFDSNELCKTLEKALDIFCHQTKIWRQLQLNGMKQDFSWGKSARQYLKLYKKLLNKK
jgi:starch synthase